MPSQGAPDIYVRRLITKNQGYPLWLPGPSDDLPDEYRRVGTQIGDLGYLDARGSFVYLFNVGKAIGDPINVGRTPPAFVPLPGIHNPTNQHLYLRNHGKNYNIEATSNRKKSIGGSISLEASTDTVAPSAGLESKFNFTSSSTEGAYLALPDGSSYCRSNRLGQLQKCAIDRGHEWYKFFNGLGQDMQIHNGRLYLVTGWEKCRSWANACYSHTTESEAVSLKLVGSGLGAHIGGALHYSWELEALIVAALIAAAAVLLRHDPSLPEAPENQAIFLHGFTISVKTNLLQKLIFDEVETYKIDETQAKPPKFDDSSIPGAAKQSSKTPAATRRGTSRTAQGHGAGMGSGTARSLNFNGPRVEGSSYDEYLGSDVPESSEDQTETNTSVMNIPYGYTTLQDDNEWDQITNPSALINKHILDTHPDATIALTHDGFEWTGMENNVRDPLNVMELAKYAIDNNLISINESETTPNAWVAKQRDTDIGVGTLTRQADIYFRGTLHEVTLSAFTETGQTELSIEVPKQRSYSGRSPVISSHLADTPCAILGVQGVLDQLNATLGTSHTLHTAHSSSKSTASPAPSSAASIKDQLSLLSILEDFVVRNDDFGTAYALLRTVWNTTENPSGIQDELRRREGEDRERRQKALVGNRIVNPNLTPRRVWDLYSNRVVPSWITQAKITPISHAWVDEKDRMDVLTPINGMEWPVPIPKDADLNLIRIEMLNLGAEYAWLDVLCLRQKGGTREDLRVEEWKLDVPTIGSVYEDNKVVIYLSGLGRPLKLKDDDLDSDRNWFRRAWTLQEEGHERTIAGDTPDGPMHALPIDGGNHKTALLTRFHEELNSDYISAGLKDTQKRVSTNPVDKGAELAFPLQPRTIPAYHKSKPEDTWTALVNAMHPYMRTRFLLVHPGVGVGGKKWRPTWYQVMMEPPPKYVDDLPAYVQQEPLPKDVDNLQTCVQHNDKTDEDWFNGLCIEEGHVRGFDTGPEEGRDRCGELVVKATDGIAHTFKIHVTHQFPIPEDIYTLLGDMSLSYHWAIGKRLPDGKFEKVSVIVMDDLDDKERQELKDLISAAKSRIVLM